MTKRKARSLPREVKEFGGPGHTKVYALINSGELPARKMGRRTYILITDLMTWLNALPPVPPRGEK